MKDLVERVAELIVTVEYDGRPCEEVARQIIEMVRAEATLAEPVGLVADMPGAGMYYGMERAE